MQEFVQPELSFAAADEPCVNAQTGPVRRFVAPAGDYRVAPAGVEPPEPGNGFQLGFGQAGSLHAPDVLLEQLAGASSRKVSRADALRVPAVLRARNMIASIPATLSPQVVNERTNELDARTSVVRDPDPAVEATVVYAHTFEDLFFHGVSYWRVLRLVEGFPSEARHLDHRAVSQHAIVGMPSEVISEDHQFTPNDPIFVDGIPAGPKEVIRFLSPNPPFLIHAAKAIRVALVLAEAAERYARDPMPLGVFEDSEDQTDPLQDEEVKKILNDWEAARRKRVWGYVSKGLKLRELNLPSPEDLQLVEARQEAALEIARASGLDPEDVGVSTTTRTYQNQEQRRLDLIDFVLMAPIKSVSERLSKNDVLPRGIVTRFDPSGFLRSDMKSRFEAHQIALANDFREVNEIRRTEGWPDLPERRPAARNGNGNGNEPTAPAMAPFVAPVLGGAKT